MGTIGPKGVAVRSSNLASAGLIRPLLVGTTKPREVATAFITGRGSAAVGRRQRSCATR